MIAPSKPSLAGAVTAAEKKLLAEVKQDLEAYERLQAKCRLEGMSLYAVLRSWGDPRIWGKK